MEEKRDQGKVYQFTPRKGPKLKTLKYVSPEKKQLLKQREQAQKDKRYFYTGVGMLLIIVLILTILRLT